MRYARYIIILLGLALAQQLSAQIEGDGLSPRVNSFHRYSLGDVAVPSSSYLWRITKGTTDAKRFTTISTGKGREEILQEAMLSDADYAIVGRSSDINNKLVYNYLDLFTIASSDSDFIDFSLAGSNYEIYILWIKEGVYKLQANEFNQINKCTNNTQELAITVKANDFSAILDWNGYKSNTIPAVDLDDNNKIPCALITSEEKKNDKTIYKSTVNFKLTVDGYRKNWTYRYKWGIKYNDEQLINTVASNIVLTEPSEADWKQENDSYGHNWNWANASPPIDGLSFVDININEEIQRGVGYAYIWVKITFIEDGYSTPVNNLPSLVRCAILKQLPDTQTIIFD